jgi:hypothetical protein
VLGGERRRFILKVSKEGDASAGMVARLANSSERVNVSKACFGCAGIQCATAKAGLAESTRAVWWAAECSRPAVGLAGDLKLRLMRTGAVFGVQPEF